MAPPDDPVLEDRPLSQWLDLLDRGDKQARIDVLNCLYRTAEYERPELVFPAIPAVIRALQDVNEEVRAEARVLIHKLGPAAKAATPVLLEMCRRADSEDRMLLASDLIAIGSEGEALPILLAFIKNPDEEPGEAVRRALSTIDSLGPRAQTTVPDIRKIYKSTRFDDYGQVTLTLGYILGPDVIPVLIEELEGGSSSARKEIAWGFENFGTKAEAAVAPLLRVLRSDPNAEARASVAQAIGAIRAGTRRIPPEMPERLHAETTLLARAAIAGAIGRIDPTSEVAMDAFDKLLDEPDSEFLSSALIHLRFFVGKNGKRLIPKLVPFLYSDNKSLQHMGTQILVRIGEAAARPITAVLDSDNREAHFWALLALDELHMEKSVRAAQLVRILENKPKYVGSRQMGVPTSAIIVLGAVTSPDDRDAVPYLLEALEDPSDVTRKAAVEGLGRIGKNAASSLPALRKLLKDEEEAVRQAAAEAIRRIQP